MQVVREKKNSRKDITRKKENEMKSDGENGKQADREHRW